MLMKPLQAITFISNVIFREPTGRITRIVWQLTLSCRSIYPMSSLKVFYHKLDYYNDVHISLEILNVFQPNLAEIWLMHYSVIKR